MKPFWIMIAITALVVAASRLLGYPPTIALALFVCGSIASITFAHPRTRRRIKRWLSPDTGTESDQTAGSSSSVLTDLLAVRDWILAVRKDDASLLGARIGEDRIEKWVQIATEVRLRKSLILAAARDLGMALTKLEQGQHSNLSLRPFEIGGRGAAPSKKAGRATSKPKPDEETGSSDSDLIRPNVLVMAATDVFAEKAQKTLTDRAQLLILLGSVVAAVALGSLVFGAYWISSKPVAELFTITRVDRPLSGQSSMVKPDSGRTAQAAGNPVAPVATSPTDAKNTASPVDPDWSPTHYFWLVLIQRSTVSGLLLGAVYFLVMVSRALLHEAMVLYGRRHSLRFGRLYVYSKIGHVKFEEMEKAFAWSSEHSSAFADIRGEKISKGLVQAITDVAKEVAKSTASAVSDAAKVRRRPQ